MNYSRGEVQSKHQLKYNIIMYIKITGGSIKDTIWHLCYIKYIEYSCIYEIRSTNIEI